MATYQALAQEIIEFHEKLNYTENTSIRPRVLEAINRAVNHVWSKADWTFRARLAEIEYDPSIDNNQLPSDFMSFQHTGRVILLNGEGGDPVKTLQYIPLNRMLDLLKGRVSGASTPEVYSLGGRLEFGATQRSIFVYPRPADVSYLRLIYQASAHICLLEDWAAPIYGIPDNWHGSVVKEVAILFRMMDKSADITAQAALVKSALDAMLRDEPHGREDTPQIQPFMGWRMNVGQR